MSFIAPCLPATPEGLAELHRELGIPPTITPDEGATLTVCAECARACWIMPIKRGLAARGVALVLCYLCALRALRERPPDQPLPLVIRVDR